MQVYVSSTVICYSTGDRDSALNYRKGRRKIDPALYNEHRLREKPYPKSKSSVQPKSRSIIQPTLQSKPSNTVVVIRDFQVDTPPMSPISTPEEVPSNSDDNSSVDSESSTEDVICLTEGTHVARHRPFSNFDVISGRHSFTCTVMIYSFFDNLNDT